MPRVVHFDLGAESPERAAKFYEVVFGWKAQKWGGGPMDYWLVVTGPDGEPGINGGISRRRSGSEPVMNTIGVPSVDEYIEKVKAGGGQVVRPKGPIPGVGWFAQCQDTEGNLFGLMQTDPSAK